MQHRTGPGGRHFIRLDRGDKLIESLSAFCSDHDVRTGILSGIGAVEDIRLGLYDLAERRYVETHLEETHELVSFSGNVTEKKAAPFIHAHAVLSDRECRARGGHLMEATVAVLVEVVLEPASILISRTFDDDIGLFAWNLEKER